jgi:NodT family efflux transporter outer membrane factor (OMF) lipoprotein
MVDSADANLDSSVAEYDAVLVCLIAEVAVAYVDIRTFQQRLRYARRNVEIQQKSLELAKTRADEGKTGDVSVYLSKSSLESTKATIPSLKIGLRQANNRLCTLLGQPTVDIVDSLGDELGIPSASPEIALGIPADLLRRRPDVRQAERNVAAQSEQIGIALADLYPQFKISGEISVKAESFSPLFTSGSTGGSVGPSFNWSILNYGRIINNVRQQDARFQELVATYQNAVLTANQEVEDALVAFLQNQVRVKTLTANVDATRHALELELIRFKEGEADFTGVFILQGDLAAKQDQLAASQSDVITSLIGVYKALGGGWEIRCPDFHPREISVVKPDPEDLDLPPTPPSSMKEALPELTTNEEN